MHRCRFLVIMPKLPGTSAGISKLSQPFETMKRADLGIGLSIWRSIECFAGTLEGVGQLPTDIVRNLERFQRYGNK